MNTKDEDGAGRDLQEALLAALRDYHDKEALAIDGDPGQTRVRAAAAIIAAAIKRECRLAELIEARGSCAGRGPAIPEDVGGEYRVVLTSPGDKKVATIKEIRAITSASLKDSKDMIEACPEVVLSTNDREDANSAVMRLTEAGASVHVEWDDEELDCGPTTPPAGLTYLVTFSTCWGERSDAERGLMEVMEFTSADVELKMYSGAILRRGAGKVEAMDLLERLFEHGITAQMEPEEPEEDDE